MTEDQESTVSGVSGDAAEAASESTGTSGRSDAALWQQLGAAAILETQMAECTQIMRDLAEYARHPDVPNIERMGAIATIGHLLDHCAGVGKVVARLNGTETVHRSVVERNR
jgi:hypothetical protein